MLMRSAPNAQALKEADPVGLVRGGENRRRGQIIVVFTTHAETVAALKLASRLSANLGKRPQVLMLYDVPYTLPLEERALPEGFFENQLRTLKRDSPQEVSLRICLCRHPGQILRQVLPSDALIVIGGKKRWWPTRERRLASSLRKAGYEVVFAESR